MDRRVRLLLLATGAIALAVLLLGRGREPEPVGESPPPAEPPPVGIQPARTPSPPTVDPPVPWVQGAGPHAIESGHTLGIERRDLPGDTPLLLDLLLPADLIPPEPTVRVIAPDGRVLETPGRPAERADGLRLPLDSAWLTRGRYVIEVPTLERSHFPLRRFALEVR